MTGWVRGLTMGVGAALVHLAASVAMVRLCAINTSPSLPMGIYRVVAAIQPVVGDMVLVCLPLPIADFALARRYLTRGSCASGVEPLGKRVAAIAGDTVVVTVDGVLINGILRASTMPLRVDSHGRSLPQLVGEQWILRPGQLWLEATGHRRSFDSRYFGPLSINAVVAVARPLSTE